MIENTNQPPSRADDDPAPDSVKFADLLGRLTAPEREQVMRMLDSLLEARIA